jgi:hypothetical protein
MLDRDKIQAQFESSIDHNVGAYNDLLKAIDKKTNEDFLHGMIASQLAFTLLSIWEAYLSDVIIAYVAKSPKKMMESIKERVEKSLKDKFGSEIAKSTALTFSHELSQNSIMGIIDPKGVNISRAEPRDFTNLANEFLTGHHARKFTFNQKDREFYIFLKKLRNYLAHGSVASREELNKVVASLAHADNAVFKCAIGRIGSYLKSPCSATSRVVVVSDRLKIFSRQLI